LKEDSNDNGKKTYPDIRAVMLSMTSNFTLLLSTETSICCILKR